MKSIRFLAWPVAICIIFSVSLHDPSRAAVSDDAASPESDCSQLAADSWTNAEIWAWKQLCNSKVADFDKHVGNELVVESQKAPFDRRLLRSSFIETILLRPPYLHALPRKGLRLIGAVIDGEVDLNNANIPAEIKIERSRFMRGIRLDGATFHLGAAFKDCYISDSFRAGNVRGKPFFTLANSTFRNDVDLSGARIEGPIFADGAIFLSKLTALGAKIDDALFAANTTFGGRATFNGARIGESLVISNSTFSDDLILNNIELGRSLESAYSKYHGHFWMRTATIHGDAWFPSSVFRKSLTLTGSYIVKSLFLNKIIHNGSAEIYRKYTNNENVNIDGVTIDRDIIMEGALFHSNVNLHEIHVGRSLNDKYTIFDHNSILDARSSIIGNNVFLQGANLINANFRGSHITGGLLLSDHEGNYTKWSKNSTIDLRNVKMDWLQDNEYAWPNQIRNIGMHYNYWTGSDAIVKETVQNSLQVFEVRPIEWFQRWLSKEPNYSPQPYEKLSQVIRDSGHKEKAKYISYLGRDRERKDLAENWDFLCKSILNILIGYGYKLENLIPYGLFFILMGCVAGFNQEQLRKNNSSAIEYSIDTFMPIINLRKQHEGVDFVGWRRYYFYVHKLMGWILAFFLVAVLTGVIK